MIGFTIFMSVVAIMIGVAALRRRFDISGAVERSEARRIWAKARDLVVVDRPDPRPPLFSDPITGVDDKRLNPFRALKFIAEEGVVHNFQEGLTNGREVRVFDHRKVIADGKHRRVIEHSIVAVKLKTSAPKFELKPHKLWDHVTALFGHRDITIGAPAFDTRFALAAADDKFLPQLLNGAVQARLLAHRNDSWHCINGFIIVVGRGYRSEQELSRMLLDALWFAEQIDR